MTKDTVIIFLLFGSISILSYQFMPLVFKRAPEVAKKATPSSSVNYKVFLVLPVIIAPIFYIATQSLLWAIGGALVGLVLPIFVEKRKIVKYRSSFVGQLVDALMILSSSLKGGLSLIQAMEVLVEEMPPPLSWEFSQVIRETKLGMSLEESLRRMQARMPSEELDLIVSAIIVARETGGDLTKVFFNLVSTIRDRIKLKNTVETLTLQGRLQGLVLSILPIGFVMFVYSNNPHHFDIMMAHPMGRMLLIIAGALQIIGMLLIKKFSKVEI